MNAVEEIGQMAERQRFLRRIPIVVAGQHQFVEITELPTEGNLNGYANGRTPTGSGADCTASRATPSK